MIADFDLKIHTRKPAREEMFNLRNRQCQEAFKNETENNAELIECFDNNSHVEEQSKKWLKNQFTKPLGK